MDPIKQELAVLVANILAERWHKTESLSGIVDGERLPVRRKGSNRRPIKYRPAKSKPQA